jgi:hypothetical protein
MEDLIDALPGPSSMHARLFAFLGQDEEGSSISTARFRIPANLLREGQEDSRSNVGDARARQSQSAKIGLAEDPVESYLATRKTSEDAGSDGTDWLRILKWVALLFLLLQLFWWMAPSLARVQLGP